jgi:hypothetical protein
MLGIALRRGALKFALDAAFARKLEPQRRKDAKELYDHP